MEPIRIAKKSIEELLAPTRRDAVTGRLVPVPARERIDNIISHPHARRIVEAMDAQSVFGLIREAGINDALELVEMATPQQLQAFVDFDAWTKDEFELRTFTDWLELILQSSDERFAAMYKAFDHQAFVLWFRETVAVYEWEEDLDLLDRIEDNVYTSPCGQFAMVIPDEENYAAEVRLFLERLYAMDIEEALTLMSEARWNLSIELQEELYQARTARLAEFGFVPFDEAIAIFGWLDPIEWARNQRERLVEGTMIEAPLRVGELAPLDQQLVAVEECFDDAEGSWFARAMAALPSIMGDALAADVLGATMTQLRAVAQRVLVADQGIPGDPDMTLSATRRALNAISLGLEFVADGDVKLAARVLAAVPLRDIHRAGFSVGLQLQRQARDLAARGNLSVTDAPISLLQPEDAALIEGLLQPRPLMSMNTGRRFRTMADVKYVAERMGQIAFAELLFFAFMGFDKPALVSVLYNEEFSATPVELVSFRMLFATLLLNRVVDNERALMPMSLEELYSALDTMRQEANPLSWLLDRGRVLVDGLQPPGKKMARFPLAFVAETVTWMVDEMLGQAPPTREIAQQWVLLRPEGAAAPTHDRPE